MEERQKEEMANGQETLIEGTNVRLFVRPTVAPRREPPVTPEELAQYRALLPRLIRAVEIVERIALSPSGCPVARSVLDLED